MCCSKPDQAQSKCPVALDYKSILKISYELALHDEKRSMETGILLKMDLVKMTHSH